jgi:hypothetical protein
MLYIADQEFCGEFTETKYKEMLNALSSVPKPNIEYNVVIEKNQKAANELFILQGEYAYIDRAHIANQIDTVATKYLSSCIFLILYNESDCMAAHIDQMRDTPISQWLANFKYPETINVQLLGGDNSATSKATLRDICGALLSASNYGNTKIRINYKSLNKDNELNQEDKYRYIFDRIIYKADLLKRCVFSRPLDKEKLLGISPEQLKKSKTTSRTFNDMLAAMFEKKASKDLENIFSMVNLLNNLTEAKDLSAQELAKKNTAKLGVQVENFEEFLTSFLSQEAFQMLDYGYSQKNIYPDSNLRNIKVDLNNNKISVVSSVNQVAFEGQRFGHLLKQMSNMATGGESLPLYNCYDNENQAYRVRSLSVDIFKKFQETKVEYNKLLTKNQMTTILNSLNIENSLLNHKMVGYVVYNQGHLAPYHHSLNSFNKNSSFWNINKDLGQSYHDPKTEPEVLGALNQVLCADTEAKFQAKVRNHVHIIVDALLPRDNMEQAEQFIKTHVKAWGLEAYIVKFRDTTAPMVCIPEINLAKQSDNIAPLSDCYENKSFTK